ncbi:hypothetical protein QYB63_001221 [Clostridium perfringens]|nr:hypothetical protein [Clostridium perfringens]
MELIWKVKHQKKEKEEEYFCGMCGTNLYKPHGVCQDCLNNKNNFYGQANRIYYKFLKA